jgi:hypothetical protein
MVMTVLEAHVVTEQWEVLRQIFTEHSSTIPPQMVQSLIVQSAADPTLWQIISIWHNREALQEYRRSVETPNGILMFRSAGAEPTLTIFDVVVEAHS